MLEKSTRIAIVGASGVVGREALSILASRDHPANNLRLLGSQRSAGATVEYPGGALPIELLTPDSFRGVDCALFCADADTARRFAPIALGAGALVIDNSSAFRMNPAVPLVIPEVNPEALEHGARLIANPNCSTIILLTALEPIRRALGVRRIVVSTYQAVSGAGAAGLEELRSHTRAIAQDEMFTPSVFPEPCALNVFTHESALDPVSACNGEEQKIIAETRRIWDAPDLPILPTCVRVPVERAHSESVSVELDRRATREDIEGVLARAPGVELWSAAGPRHPTPIGASGRDAIHVGRVRVEPPWCSLWICGDQLRKGAALNAIQIADLALRRDYASV